MSPDVFFDVPLLTHTYLVCDALLDPFPQGPNFVFVILHLSTALALLFNKSLIQLVTSVYNKANYYCGRGFEIDDLLAPLPT